MLPSAPGAGAGAAESFNPHPAVRPDATLSASSASNMLVQNVLLSTTVMVFSPVSIWVAFRAFSSVPAIAPINVRSEADTC